MKILRPHQRKMLAYTFKAKHPALFVQMRLGKTLVTIRRCKAYKDCEHFLIIAPYPAFDSWINELYDEEQGAPIILDGPIKERLGILEKYWDSERWFICSKENNRYAPEVYLKPWDVTIADEGTFLKEPKAKVTKFFMKYFRNVKHRWDLTGTPAPYSELNYFCQLRYLDNSYLSMYKNYWDFRDSAFTVNPFESYKYELTKIGRKHLHTCLAKNAFFMTRKDAGIKDERNYITRRINFPPQLRKLYNKVEKEFAMELDKGKEVTTKFATARYRWMYDLCSGYNSEKFIWEGKFKELKYLLETELKGEKVVIYCNRIPILEEAFKHFKKKYSSRLVHGGMGRDIREKNCRDFKLGRYQLLFANPELVKFAKDFSQASTVVYFTQVPNETRLQSEERIFSLNKEDSLLYIDIITEDSIEEDYYNNRLSIQDDNHMTRIFINRIKEKYAIH